MSKSFFAISVFICVWALADYLTGIESLGIHVDDILNRVAFLSALMVVTSGVWFAYSFYNPKNPAPRSINIFKASTIFMGVLSISTLVSGDVITENGTVHFSVGYLLPVFVAYLVILLGLILNKLIGAVRNGSGRERQQALYIAIAFGIPLLVGLFTNAIIPIVTSNWSTASSGPSFTVLMVAIIAYSMLRHKLFDIHFFVIRAAAYLSTFLVITFIFVIPFVIFINFLMGDTMSIQKFVSIVLLLVLLLYVIQAFRHYFDEITGKIFFRNTYDTQEVLDRLSDVLVRTSDIRILKDSTGRIIQGALKSKKVWYLLDIDGSDEDQRLIKLFDDHCVFNRTTLAVTDDLSISSKLHKILRANNIAIAVRLRTTHENLGCMFLSYKQSGEVYTDRDLRLLTVAADEVAISLQNSLRFEEIQRFNITLQERIDNATRRLKRSNEKLQELDEIKDDFISMASHQLRTPLTSVKGYLSMVIEGDAGKLNSTQQEMLGQAYSSSQRMVSLITDLLNISRLKTGKFVIEPTPTNLGDIIRGEVAQLAETAKSKNITLTYKKPVSFPTLMLDEVKIRQVIMNFIDNAIYYTPPGGHIRIELADKQATIELRVVDDGIGVPRSEQHHLFSKFYRATNARKVRPDGTGLGLFMAKKVIVAQGGSLIFTSEEGHGSTFGFTFVKDHLRVLSIPTTPSALKQKTSSKVSPAGSEKK